MEMSDIGVVPMPGPMGLIMWLTSPGIGLDHWLDIGCGVIPMFARLSDIVVLVMDGVVIGPDTTVTGITCVIVSAGCLSAGDAAVCENLGIKALTGSYPVVMPGTAAGVLAAENVGVKALVAS